MSNHDPRGCTRRRAQKPLAIQPRLFHASAPDEGTQGILKGTQKGGCILVQCQSEGGAAGAWTGPPSPARDRRVRPPGTKAQRLERRRHVPRLHGLGVGGCKVRTDIVARISGSTPWAGGKPLGLHGAMGEAGAGDTGCCAKGPNPAAPLPAEGRGRGAGPGGLMGRGKGGTSKPFLGWLRTQGTPAEREAPGCARRDADQPGPSPATTPTTTTTPTPTLAPGVRRS